jgi:hypothetical protein
MSEVIRLKHNQYAIVEEANLTTLYISPGVSDAIDLDQNYYYTYDLIRLIDKYHKNPQEYRVVRSVSEVRYRRQNYPIVVTMNYVPTYHGQDNNLKMLAESYWDVCDWWLFIITIIVVIIIVVVLNRNKKRITY